jgi:CubicO group peptidase (beta-lactamase class C family)
MKHRFLKSGSLISLIIILHFSCQAPDKSSNSFSQEKVAALDTFLTQLHQTLSLPGVAIAIVKDNAVYFKAVGHSDVLQGTTLMDSTPLFMGNLSELMAATGAVKLAQSGKLNLDDPVIKYLPYFKTGGEPNRQIRIRHLLTHTSGVPHHDALWDIPAFDDRALEGITQSIAMQQPEFTPAGTRVKRSQYNYDILADVMEKASGMRFEDYMNKEVLHPLGMKHAAYYDSTMQYDQVASPHVINNWLTYALTRRRDYPHNREHAGSIGFHASVRDLTKWMSMILNQGEVDGQQFIDSDQYKELIDTHYQTGKDTYIGFGWEVRKQEGQLLYTKNHYIGGFSADIALLPDQDMGIAVISNISEEFDATLITDQIAQWLMGGKLPVPKTPVHLAMGHELDATHSLDSALELYTELKQLYPDRYDYSHAALSKLGVNLMHRLGKKEDAIRVFDFILKQHPSSPYAHLNLAEAYVVSNNIAKAEEQLKIVKKLSPQAEPTISSHMAYLEEAIGIMKEKKPDPHPDDYYSN